MGITITDYETNLKNDYNSRQKELAEKAGNVNNDAHAPIYSLIQKEDKSRFADYLADMKNARFPNNVETNNEAAITKEKEVTDNYWNKIRKSVEEDFNTVGDPKAKTVLITEAFDNIKPTFVKITDKASDVWEKIKNPNKETAIDASGAAVGGLFGYLVAELFGTESAVGKFLLSIAGAVAGWMITEKLRGNSPTVPAPIITAANEKTQDAAKNDSPAKNNEAFESALNSPKKSTLNGVPNGGLEDADLTKPVAPLPAGNKPIGALAPTPT